MKGLEYMKKRLIPLLLNCGWIALAGCQNTTSDSTAKQNSSSEETSSVNASDDKDSSVSSSISVDDSHPLYVSPTGTYQGKGTKESPYDFMTAVKSLTPGNTLYLMEGTYSFSTTQMISYGVSDATDSYHVTSEEGRRTIQPEVVDGKKAKVVFDFSSMSFNSSNRGVSLNSDYWTLKDIEVFGAGDNGVYIGGNYNVVEHLDIHDCQDSGLQLGRKSSSCNTLDTWPSHNLIKNVTSHDNHDPSGEDSDGFACKLTTGYGNVFDGCISYNNVDDGWDLYTKGDSGPIGPVTIRNCIAFNNGITTQGVGTNNSDGNGFKLGGESIAVSHVVENCIAFNNLATGFTDNSNPGTITFKNCTAFNNGTRDLDAANFDLCRDVNTSTNYYKNLLSYCSGNRVNPITGSVNKANSRDRYKGNISYSVFYSGLSMLKYKTPVSGDFSVKGKCGTTYSEPNGKEPFVSMTTPQEQSMKDVPVTNKVDIHSLLRAEDGSIKLGDFLKVNPQSEFYKLGEDGKPLGADLSGESK